jgi:hypothetical protein
MNGRGWVRLKRSLVVNKYWSDKRSKSRKVAKYLRWGKHFACYLEEPYEDCSAFDSCDLPIGVCG